MSGGTVQRVRLDRCRAVAMGTRPAATFRMVSSLSVALLTPFGVWGEEEHYTRLLLKTQKIKHYRDV